MKKTKSFVFERNFLILMIGVFINSIGSGIYLVAGMLLVFELTGSVLFSGIAMFAISLASVLGFLIAPFANYTKYRNGLIYSNLIKSIILLTLPIIDMSIGLNVWYVIALLFVTSLFTQFTYPIESTILPIIVESEKIIQANSYLQTIREAMNIAFLALAGVIVMLIGSVQAITITAFSVLVVSLLYTLFNFSQPSLDVKELHRVRSSLEKYLSDLKDGFIYIKSTIIPQFILSIIFVNLSIAVMTANMPAFALLKGDGDESAYGFYLASMSFGILLGTILSPKVKHYDFGKLIIITFMATGVMWLGTAYLSIIPSMILFSIGAISIGFLNILIFSSIQKQVAIEYIGRVITLVTSTASLGIPIGSLLGGVIGETYNPVVSVIIASLGMVIFGLYWLINSRLRSLPDIERANILGRNET